MKVSNRQSNQSMVFLRKEANDRIELPCGWPYKAPDGGMPGFLLFRSSGRVSPHLNPQPRIFLP